MALSDLLKKALEQKLLLLLLGIEALIPPVLLWGRHYLSQYIAQPTAESVVTAIGIAVAAVLLALCSWLYLRHKYGPNREWDRQKLRYTLVSPFSQCQATTVFALKESMSNGELPHYVCTKCYGDKRTEKLQPRGKTDRIPYAHYVCLVCGSEFHTRQHIAPPAEYA